MVVIFFVLSSEKAKKIINKQQPISRDIVNRVKNKLAERGVVLEQSEEIDKNLVKRSREAVVYEPGDIILMHTRVSASGFYEELIHYGQLKRRGFNTSSPVDVIKMEIEAQEKLIKYRRAYKITDEEIEILTKNLNWYLTKLSELEKGGVQIV